MGTLFPAAAATKHHTEAQQSRKLSGVHILRIPAIGNIKHPRPTTYSSRITTSAFGKQDRDDAPDVTGPSGESMNLPVKETSTNVAQRWPYL